MSELIVLELSQEKTENVSKNGEFNVQLSKEIEINEGDEIGIKNAFVDTTTITSSNIVIENDLQLKIEHGFYLNNWLTSAELSSNKEFFYRNDQTHKNIVDGKDYALFLNNTQSGIYDILDTLTFYYEKRDEKGKFWGDLDVQISYVSLSGDTKIAHYYVPQTRRTHNLVDVSGNKLVYKQGSLKYINKEQFASHNMSNKVDITNSAGPSPSGDSFEPYIVQSVIDLPKGNYEPQELAFYLSQQLSENFIGSTGELLDSPYFTTIAKLNTDTGETPIFVNEDLTHGFTISNTGDEARFLVGTNQIQFSYNTTYNKFEIDYLHMPMMDSTGGTNMSVRYLGIKGDPVGGGSALSGDFATSKNGGIFLTSLTAVEKDSGKNYNFWEDELGFNLDKLLVKFIHDPTKRTFKDNSGTNAFSNIAGYTYELKNTQHVTEGYYGLDSVIKKGADPAWFLIGQTTSPIISTINSTDSIIADNAYNTSQLNGSHYLLEVQSNFTTSLINQKLMSNKVLGIVNRYYGYQSFTSSGSESGVPYIHKGDPIFLKSFKVRILDPEYGVPDNLGSRNTIFLQVVKAQQQQKK